MYDYDRFTASFNGQMTMSATIYSALERMSPLYVLRPKKWILPTNIVLPK